MNVIALILFIIAAVLFLLASASAGEPVIRRVQTVGVSLGLCVLTVGFIVQFMATTHTAHF